MKHGCMEENYGGPEPLEIVHNWAINPEGGQRLELVQAGGMNIISARRAVKCNGLYLDALQRVREKSLSEFRMS